MTYEYINPCDHGFIKINVPVMKHNKLMPNSKRRIGSKICYYWNPKTNHLKIHLIHKAWLKVLLILFLYIPSVFMQGVPKTNEDMFDLIFELKRGRFIEENIYLNNSESTMEIELFINSKMGGES